MPKEAFNPFDNKYKKTDDLPEDQKNNYKDVDSGFAKKEAVENMKIAELASLARGRQEEAIDLQHAEANEYNSVRNELIKRTKDIRRNTFSQVDFLFNYFGRSFKGNEPGAYDDYISRDRELLIEVGKWVPWSVMETASEELRGDKDFVTALFKNNNRLKTNFGAEMLYYASEELRDDKEIVELAIEGNPCSIATASKRLKNDLDLVLKAAKKDPSILDVDNGYHLFDALSGANIKKVEFLFLGDDVRTRLNRLLGRVEKPSEKGEQERKIA